MQEKVKEWFDVKVGEDEADAIGIGWYCMKMFKPKQIEYFEWE